MDRIFQHFADLGWEEQIITWMERNGDTINIRSFNNKYEVVLKKDNTTVFEVFPEDIDTQQLENWIDNVSNNIYEYKKLRDRITYINGTLIRLQDMAGAVIKDNEDSLNARDARDNVWSAWSFLNTLKQELETELNLYQLQNKKEIS